MKILTGLIISLAVLLLLPSCSSKEVTKDNTPKKDTVYVFDQVAPDTLKQSIPTVVTSTVSTPSYFIQIGAFLSREKAETFTDIAKKKLNHDFTINYSDNIKLFVVQMTPPYSSRPDAEKVRDEIKQIQEYRDAWIVTIDK